jgi:hypothetical protein
MAYFSEKFSPVDALTTEDIVFLQNLASDASYDSSNVVLESEVGLGSIITMTGTIDDSNKTFTCASGPSEMVINGVSYLTTGGAITWTYLAGTITLSTAVGINGTIWGRR